jgi:hypothetical protein
MTKITHQYAIELLRSGQRYLAQMHTRAGRKWFIVPGGEVDTKIAQELLARPDIQPANDGLFPGISQTFKFRSTKFRQAPPAAMRAGATGRTVPETGADPDGNSR